MKLVYTAGCYGADCDYKIHRNINHAWEIGLQVNMTGAYAVIPHTNSSHMGGIHPEQFFLDGTMELMRRCDAVMVVPGWENSSGTKGEIKEANRLGKPVFFNIDQLSSWIRKQGVKKNESAITKIIRKLVNRKSNSD